MTYRLFIDDLRNPVTKNWKIARSSRMAIEIVKRDGMPKEIAFDHDLGGEDTSKKFLFWLADFLTDKNLKFPAGFTWSIHSQNPVGAKFINDYMNFLVGFVGVNDD